MDLPNITLVFQIVNFCVAYRILYNFVFAPALQILVMQDGYKKSIEQKILTAKDEHLQTVQLQRTRWKSMKNALYNLIPSSFLTCTIAKQESKPISNIAATLSDQQKASMSKLIHDELLKVKS